MTHKLILLTPALLAACATTAPPTPDPTPAATPVHGETPGHTCQTDGTEPFVGQTRSEDTEAAIKQVSHAAVLRWAPPGVMLTMDFRADRVTVYLDSANTITKIRCG